MAQAAMSLTSPEAPLGSLVAITLVLALSGVADSSRSTAVGTSRRVHDIHLTHTRMVVDGSTVVSRVRLFHDDLEAALRRYTGKADLTVTRASPQDSVFGAYFSAKVALTSAGARLTGVRVLQSGPDPDPGDFPMWWYLVELRATAPISVLSVRFSLLFEQFPDQRNILSILKTPDERHSLYFASGDEKEQLVRFGGK
jgi:hypothetical protein